MVVVVGTETSAATAAGGGTGGGAGSGPDVPDSGAPGSPPDVVCEIAGFSRVTHGERRDDASGQLQFLGQIGTLGQTLPCGGGLLGVRPGQHTRMAYGNLEGIGQGPPRAPFVGPFPRVYTELGEAEVADGWELVDSDRDDNADLPPHPRTVSCYGLEPTASLASAASRPPPPHRPTVLVVGHCVAESFEHIAHCHHGVERGGGFTDKTASLRPGIELTSPSSCSHVYRALPTVHCPPR